MRGEAQQRTTAWAFLAAIAISVSGALPAMAEDAALVVRPPDLMDSGKLLATGGVTQLEGAGGGGLAPWALITGYGTEDEIGTSAHATYVYLPNYTIRS